VWQQERTGLAPDGRIGGGDLPGLFADPARNVFLVKWTYWLG